MPGKSWFGIDPRTYPGRLNQLCESKKLAKARALIAPLGREDLEHLERLAEVNRRQAGIVSRHTLITNVSAPLALALGLAQIFPDWVDRIMEPPHEILWTGALVAAIAGILATVQHAQIRARQAEDLHDLIVCQLSIVRHEETKLTATSA